MDQSVLHQHTFINLLSQEASSSFSQSTSYVNSQGAGASSSSSATSPDGNTSTSSRSTFVPGATSASASASASASGQGATTTATVFAGDAEDLLLWRLASSEQTLLWSMDGYQVSSTLALEFDLGSGWSTAGTGDFTGNGELNLLWHNQTTGELVISGLSSSDPLVTITAGPVTDWAIEATVDFNSDGITDILWRNPTSGDNGIWLMNSQGQAADFLSLPNASSESWSILGAGDFNHDDQADILWQGVDSDLLYVWGMDHGQYTGQNLAIETNVDSAWQVTGVGDYNSDGHADLFWQHAGGMAGIWLMEGTQRIGASSVDVSAVSGWQVTG
jgi:hypothetical protein